MDCSHSPRRVVSRLSGVALLVAILGLLTGCANPLEPGGIFGGGHKGGGPGPSPFVWREVTPAPATPQQAFAAGISNLRLCRSGPGQATTTNWLVAGPTYGVVLLRADCSNDPVDPRTGIAILPLSLLKDTHPECLAWMLAGGEVTSQFAPGTLAAPMVYEIPSWLPLPPDTYESQMLPSGLVPAALFMLESSTRLFITGRFEGKATRPDGAETVTMGGRSGWQVADHDIVTVTVPLADGWTFYFSGTADGATIQRLVSASLDHLDTLLPKPLPTPADYPQPTPAC